MSLDAVIKEKIKSGFEKLFGHVLTEKELNILPTRKEFVGDYTFVTFPVARYSKKNPEETAKILGEELKNTSSDIADFNVVKGFLNLSIHFLLCVPK